MLVLTFYTDLENAHLCLPGQLPSKTSFKTRVCVLTDGYLRFFVPGIYTYFPGKYAHNFGFKMHKLLKCQKWCNYAHLEKNRTKSRNLSNEEHVFDACIHYQQSII